MQFLALSVDDILRGLWGALCQFFYWIIAWLYELFMNISRVEVLTGNDIQPIYQRITMILTIVMVFYVTFEAVKYVIQPEQFGDKEKGASKLVLKLVLIVIMIAFVPRIFSWAYKFQNVVFDNQIFSKVILGKQNVDTEKFGRIFSANILGMFYYADEETWGKETMESGNKCEGIPCKNVVNINLNSLVEYGELPLMNLGLTSKGNLREEGTGNGVDRYYIHFDGLFATAVGALIAYMLLLYCVDAGVRVAQLAFLQIIAPIPIIGYLSPKKDGIFQKWLKQCFTTYIDLFLRVGIIYFVLLVCQILSDAYNSGTLLNNIPGEASTTMQVFIYIALIMGLLLFAKKAPDMLKELFPKSGAASGNFGLKAGERVAPIGDTWKGLKKIATPVGRVAGAASGAVIGAAAGVATGILQGARRGKALNKKGLAKGIGAGLWGATKGAVGGIIGGTARGMYNGGKKGNFFKNSVAGAQKQIQSNQRFGNREEAGYTIGHQMEDRFRGVVGLKSRTQKLEETKKPIKEQSDIYDKIYQSNKAQRDEAKKHVLEEGKGRYSGAYKEAAQRVRDLKEDTATRAEFKVGKYKSKDEAYDAYVDAIKDARQSVNKQNFFNLDGTFNTAAYEAACDRAAMKVKQEDFDSQVSKYRTQAEAEEAYRKALAEADQKLDEAEKMAINDYIDNGEWDASKGEYGDKDKVIEQHKAKLAAEMSAYNKYANNNRRINNTIVDGINGEIIVDENGTAMISEKDPTTGNEVVRGMTAKEFHTYAKAMSSRKSTNDNELIDIDNEINRIKNETENSGINEGKKS